MELIEATTTPRDGVACFNRMYLEVTRAVGHRIGLGFFADAAFMTKLDVVFANLYLDAVAAGQAGAEVPLAWRPLFEARSDERIQSIQFALAGMNAHINHDLPLAVVQACADLGTEPLASSHHADYQKVDRLLDEAEESVRKSFESAQQWRDGKDLRAVTDLVDSWAINTARDVAWDNSLLLWRVRADPMASDLAAGGLAAAAAQASRLLLVPVIS